MREQAERQEQPPPRRTPRSERSGDPFRPALQVLDGGRAAGRRQSAGSAQPARAEAAHGAADRTQAARRGTADRTGRAGGVPVQRSAARTATPPGKAAKAGKATKAGRAGKAAVAAKRAPAKAKPTRRLPRLGNPRRRLRLATVLALLMFAVIGIRLIGLQVTDAPAYAQAGLQDRLTKVILTAPRGAIYDRSGAALAHSVEASYVYADPTLVKDPAKTAAALSPLLGLAPSELLPNLSRQKRADGRESEFQYLQRGVSLETADKIMALNLSGINVAADERREVPGHDVAANLIGFTGADLNGLEGMEARYDDLLRGRNGRLIYERGRDEEYQFAPIPGGYRKETPAQPGSSLKLTIDRDVQFRTQRILFEQLRRVNATYGAAVVLDVRTGEVLAQASYPTYDAANALKYEPREREDVASSMVVDPGSVHKALVLGAALEEGAIRPDSAVVVGPQVVKGDQKFGDLARPNYRPRAMSLAGILAYSSNVGTIRIADELGAQKLYDYQLRFGLGKATGEGLPGESPGLVQPPANWSGSSYGSVPIGHGVSVTPIQMAAAYGAIANDGVWVQPHLVRSVIDPAGKEQPAADAATRRVLRPATAAALREAMEAVVAVPGATGNTAQIAGYRVAGKTGTGAQVVNGRYTRGEVSSFVGMAPADKPRFVVAVFAHTPGTGGGGAVAGPAFAEIMSYTLGRFKVPPTGAKPPRFVIYP